MTLDLRYGDDDAALAESVRRYCDDHPPRGADDGVPLPTQWWTGLAQLGVLALGTPEGGGSATTIAAVMEQLGRAGAPGPFAATFLAGQLLEESARAPLFDGSAIVAVGNAPLVPWLPVADVVISLDGFRARLARPRGAVEPVETLGGEPWGRAELELLDDLGPANGAVAVAEVALAAYLAGSGEHLLHQAARYAADRVQFRQPIGTFQSVAHPLADCSIGLTAARTLTRIAAYAVDASAPDAAAAAATARLSAGGAALRTGLQVHQTYGAMGFTVEGPIGQRSARIRQLTLHPPGPAPARELLLASHGL